MCPLFCRHVIPTLYKVPPIIRLHLYYKSPLNFEAIRYIQETRQGDVSLLLSLMTQAEVIEVYEFVFLETSGHRILSVFSDYNIPSDLVSRALKTACLHRDTARISYIISQFTSINDPDLVVDPRYYCK